MGVGAAAGATTAGVVAADAGAAATAGGILGTGISASTAIAAAGAAASIGGLAYTLSQKAPSAPSVPAVPPSANPASLASVATSGALQNSSSKMAAGAAASGFDGTLNSNPLTSPTPITAKTSLLGN